MSPGTPHRATALRVFAALSATALLVLMTSRSLPGARAQTEPEGTVWLNPPLSMVPADGGPFTVYVILEDLQHFGRLSYDDNRDTVPDRHVESDGLAAFEVKIQYDNKVLAFASAEEGPDLGRTGRGFDCLPPALDVDSVSFGCVSAGAEPPGPQGTMTLAAVTFQPVGAGASPLALEAGLTGPLGSDTVPVEVRGGIARVAGRPGAKETAPQPAGETATRAAPTPSASITPGRSQVTTEPTGAETSARPGTGGRPDDLVTGGRPSGGNDGASALDDRASSRAALWLGLALGGASAAAFLILAAVLWRRSHRAGT